MVDYQFNACERIDTHPTVATEEFYRTMMHELGVEAGYELLDRFKYSTLMPRDFKLTLDHMCDWYRGTLTRLSEKFPPWNGFGG